MGCSPWHICWGPMWASLAAQMVKNLPAMQETWVQSLSQKERATHSSIPAWRILRTEEAGWLQPMSLHKVGGPTEGAMFPLYYGLVPGARLFHIVSFTRPSTQARDMVSKFSSRGRPWSSHELTCSDSNPESPGPGAWPLPLHHTTCNPRIHGRMLKWEGHQVQATVCPGKSEVQRGTSPWTGWNRSLSSHLWTDGGSGSVISLLWASMESCPEFFLLICKQDSYPQLASRVVHMKYIMSVKSLWAHQRQSYINTVLLYMFP